MKRLIIIVSITAVVYFLLVPRCRFENPFSTVIRDRNGLLLGAKVAEDGQWRFPPADSVPFKVRKATIAFEDRYFYWHPGINPVSIFRALYLNSKAGRIVSGGSTLTMQTIRIYRKGKSRNAAEKVIEIIMATRLEIEKSKASILELYVSYAPYGGNVVGLEAASWRYFGISSDKLTWAQAATLAVLPNAPSLIHPGKNRDILVIKRNRLLDKLYRLGWIDNGTWITSKAENIPDRPIPMPILAPHLLGRIYTSSPGTNTQTTLNALLQQRVSERVEEHHRKLSYNEIQNAAALVIEVETGEILAYAGNCGYPLERDHANDVDIIVSPRSTGSLLKPLLYAAMIEDGKVLPTSLIADIPINLEGFSPQNFDGQFEGAVRASRALSRSLNVPAVEMLKQYGVERFQQLVIALGMNTITKPSGYYGLSLILGGAEGSLEEMANIYASLSRVLNHYGETGSYYSGDYFPATFLMNRDDQKKRQALSQAEILNASSIWYSYLAMKEVNRPDAEAGWQRFSSSGNIAWKTGTSFGYRDGWAIGTSRKYVVGVWVGNADGEGRPGLTGIAAAAPLMFEIFGLLPGTSWFNPPTDELIPAVVCPESGYLAGPDCPVRDTVNIPISGIRSPVCRFHRLVHVTADHRFRVSSDCYPVENMIHEAWFVLPPVQEWYYKKHHADYKSLPSYLPGCEPAGQRSMDLVYPGKELRIFIPRGLQGEKGRVIFEAVHTNPDAIIYWHLDDLFIGATRFIHQVELLPVQGEHRLILIDDQGEELVRKFVALDP